MADIVDEKKSLMDSAIGPVLVTTTTYANYTVDDYVKMSSASQAEYLRILNKASTVDPLDAKGRPPVNVGDYSLGGIDA